ncbi:EI24 domain-containing protein [Comamonas sp. BIGb0124]|uniref:EI24 domain-containing protein n=1 Tax=Comamonas sp. BIGb0124 TaxID=2485130 RepID=UPI000F489606|nr:EI24 domain-containing protein [Comamonas sp. BIGb0124]
MNLLLSSFWRATGQCLLPRVIGMSLLPLALLSVLASAWAYVYWNASVQAVQTWLGHWGWIDATLSWLGAGQGEGFRQVLAPVLVLLLVTPVLVVVCLLVVGLIMSPVLSRLVAARRFPHLERKRGASLAGSLLWATWSSLIALAALAVSLPLWFIPPLILVVPPLIWGWLTYRIMAYDALAEHASKEERTGIMRAHRLPLLAMGILCGLLGTAPAVLWASGIFLAVAFVIIIPLAMWLYTVIFAFSALWFANYALAALEQRRLPAYPVSEPPPPAENLATPQSP